MNEGGGLDKVGIVRDNVDFLQYLKTDYAYGDRYGYERRNSVTLGFHDGNAMRNKEEIGNSGTGVCVCGGGRLLRNAERSSSS